MALRLARNNASVTNYSKASKENEPEAGRRITRAKKFKQDSRPALAARDGTQTYQRKPRQAFQEKNPQDLMEVDPPVEVKEAPRVQDYPVIPEGVADVDKIDGDNPQLCAEYTPFMYAYLRQLEGKMSLRKDFLRGCHVNGKMRAILLDWLIDVHLQFKLLQETLYLTIYIIDKFLQQEGMVIKRKELQLVGVTAMFTASKVEEMYAPEIGDFIYITDNAYNESDIQQMELRILSSLNFGLGRPLPLHFLRRYSKAGDVDITHHTVAKYVIELTQLEYEMAHHPPSIIAAASLYLAILLLSPEADMDDSWTPTLEYYSTYAGQKLLPIVGKIASILKRAGKGKLKAVFSKYQSGKYMRVADMEELRGARLSQLSE